MGSNTATDLIYSSDAQAAYSQALGFYEGYGRPREDGVTVLSALMTPNTASHALPDDISRMNDVVVPVTKNFEVKKRKVRVTMGGSEYVQASVYSGMAVALAAGLTRVTEATVVVEPRLPKPTVTIPEEEMTRVYDVHNGFHAIRELSGFTTLAQARAAAVEWVKSGKSVRVSVKARVVRGKDDRLMVVEQETPETVSVTLEVTEEIPAKGAAVDGHFVYFWVHS